MSQSIARLSDEVLSAFLEGDLDPDEMVAVSAQIESDVENQKALEEIRKTMSALSSLAAPPEESDALSQRIAHGVERKLRRRSRGALYGAEKFNKYGVYTAAGVILVILLTLFLFSQVNVEVRDAETGQTGDEMRHLDH